MAESIIHPVGDPCSVVIFGASGDLTCRKLVPALHTLSCEGLLADETRIIGVARSDLETEDWLNSLEEGVQSYARLNPAFCERWPSFRKRMSYHRGSYDDSVTYTQLASLLQEQDEYSGTSGNRLFYLAVPPQLYPVIVEQLGRAGLNRSTGWVRIVIEKPFGYDLASSTELDEQVHAVFEEEQVLRIDHYLGKETVQNLLMFRFGNAIFEPLWNRNYVDHVQITMSETVGVGHRAGYYDRAGVVRDMLQNHLLQLLTLTAMEPPAAFDARSLRDEKVKVLKAICANPPREGVWGQYRGYLNEPDVAVGSKTPTYIALKVMVDNWRWQGVPFYVRSGKNLAYKTTEITLQFKQPPHLLFPNVGSLAPNRLVLYIQPNEGVHLSFGTKQPGFGMHPQTVNMMYHYGQTYGEQALPDAYERLLLDAMQGDASLFARSDEIQQAWTIVEPLLQGHEPVVYEPGSSGPDEADALLTVDGRNWSPLREDYGGQYVRGEAFSADDE